MTESSREGCALTDRCETERREEDRPQSELFEAFSRELLREGNGIRFQARGASMSPAIRDGEMVQVKSVVPSELHKGDIVLVKGEMGFRLHRLVVADAEQDVFITRGDCGRQDDPAVSGQEIVGIAVAKEVRVGRRNFQAGFRGMGGCVLRSAARGQHVVKVIGSRLGVVRPTRLGILSLLLTLLAAPYLRSQVQVLDPTTSAAQERRGAGTVTDNFNHTTTATANGLLIVSVAMNISNAPATGVVSVTYNGTALNFWGAHNDAGGKRRVEMWYLLNPVAGTNAVNVNVQIPTAGARVGIVAAASTFSGVDQTVPLAPFVSADGTAVACSTAVTTGCSSLDVASVVNGLILDAVATGGDQTLAISAPQAQEWNLSSASGTDPPGVTSTGSSRTGAPSVPISETFSGTSAWSLGAVSINPSAADIGVTTSVSAVPLGQPSVYTITVFNNGPSPANNVVLTDTLAAGLTGTATTTAGSCAGTGPITCNLGTVTSGAPVTITVTSTAGAAGFYPNTATVTDSVSPPDPNTGNNTYVALAPVVSVVCSTTTLTAGGTLSGVVNTYYPGTASVAAGATSIPVGASTGAGVAIANGSLLLVIQMQDASINTSNSVAYGNGSTGTGFTTINNAGNYEFVKATGPVAAGSVPITAAGTGGGLVFGYTAAAASASKGQSTYQVVLVPQYTSATLGALTATAWNGSTGGILALDIAGQLNLGGAAVHVDGQGFRGGAGMQFNGGVGGANTDYRFPAPAAYTGVLENGVDAAKGEGVAGTPRWVESGVTFLQTATNYPSGTAGTDGSMAHGAPGNAGGGGTDANPATNDQNAGGGGGANGGSGGFGGDSWNTNLSSGGEGGSPFPATIDRIALGGGGGAGTRNNSDGLNQASSGSAGGGIIFIRADSLTGTATLTANGANAYNGTLNDAGGGGGAGGTIVVLAANGGESGLTLQATGGNGGNAWPAQAYALGQRHGPGGGGGGGVVLLSGTPASAPSVSGGASGLTLNTPAVPYGATAGAAGTSATNATLGQATGIQAASLCSPDMTLGKSHVGNFTRGAAASYTIPVSNVSPYGPTSGTVTINDTLPLGLTPTGATGTGWSCSVTGQTVSCTTSNSLPASSSYPSITLNATVSQAAPATVTNTAVVGGGGEANLLNDIASDTANVVSSADMSVTDAGSPNPVAAGANITYTQVVTNSGPSAADNATVVDVIPANTTLASIVVPAGWSCLNAFTGATGNIVCTNANMPGSTSGTFTVVVKVNSGTANGTVITGTVTVGSSAIDPNSSNNTASVSTIVGGNGPNLSVTNVASPVPVQAGTDITYTQVVTNTGSSPATGASFSESAVPAIDLTFVSVTPPAGWSCVGFPGIPCSNPSVGAGVSGTFTVLYLVKAGTASGTTITDTATVTATNQSFGANSAIANDVVATAAQADLVLSTAGAPTVLLAGNNITYTQTVTNNGPAAATVANLTEATPPNTTYQSVLAPAGWTCTTPAVGATGNVTCTDPTLAAGASANIVVVVNVPPSVVAPTITATSTLSATNSVNTSSTTVVTNVFIACDLTVTNSGSPSPVAVAGTITYTQTVFNHGPSNCSTGKFTEATPANTNFVSVGVVTTGGGTWTCLATGPVSCTNPSVPPGSTGTITAVYTVTGAAGTIITDTDTATTTSRDTNPSDNSATVNIAVASGAQADLSVTNSGSPNPVTAGNNITYTQSVTNNGPGTANAPVFTETQPANTSLVLLTPPAGWTCVGLTCTDSTTMAANTTANFTFVVKVLTTVATGTTITQTDSVSTTSVDPNSGNNSATVNVQVADSADLSVTNTGVPVPVLANGTITYTQVVTNNGPSTATSVTLTDTLPANTVAQSLTGPGGGWTCTLATLICTDPSLAPGAPATITYVVKVNAATPSGTPVNETATVSSAVTDPNAANNSATAADVVALATQADLVMTNSPSASSVAAGSTVTYTQSVTNNGPATTTAGMTITETTPPNTTFQGMTPPAGWTCGTLPAIGGVGSITCTDSGGLAAPGTATFSLVLQVNAGTPSGTNITDTVTASAVNMVPGITTNTASATVVVANANSADMAIVKTGTPNPVTEGTPLTYTLTVTNNGPASATNVTVTDTLPSVVTYLSTNTTQGSCSEAGGTVTCLLGTMANAGTATISILTLPNTPGVVSNTATVSADQTDPNLANNSSTQTETITAPTRITLQSFSAHTGTDKNGANRVVLTWKTGGEAHNLGFNVYREQNGNRERMNPSVIAGSALLMSGALPKHAGRSYAWIDPAAGVTGASYWLEDIDVNGTRTMHGPVSVSAGAMAGSDVSASETRMLSQINQAQPPTPGSQESHIVETLPMASAPTPSQIQKQFELAAHPAVKIYVRREGWYRVAQPDLVKAGLDPNVDPSLLHLYAEATEQPLQITGASAGPGGFGPQAAISFYGTGINTVFSGTRVYWLVAGQGRGARIPRLPVSSGSNQPALSYSTTVELQQHTLYFAALLTSNGENFFGSLVSPTVEQALDVPHLNTNSTQVARLDVALQGVITAFPHDVSVVLNGTTLGDVIFTGQDKGTLSASIPPGVLQEGNNKVTLTAQNGEYDSSLVDYIRITYPHLYVADNDQLKFTGRAGDEVSISNFDSAPAVLDITDPNRPVQLTPQVISNLTTGKFEIAVQVPFTTTNPASPARHTLLAVAEDRVASVAGVWPNHPSHWHSAQAGADIAMVTHAPFAAALAPLVRAHQAEGKSSVVVPINDLYDEFNFGERTPFAIRQFLQTANQNWKTPPAFLLLNGRASLDPRNYLGFGNLDLVPTRVVPSASLMTASDDWFSDFSGSGKPTIATGRLPVSTVDEATTVAGKIATYEGQSTNGAWTANALVVADKDDTESFTQDSQTVQAKLPATMQVTDVFTDAVGPAASGDIVNAINSGQVLVNYLGHGSEDQWSGSDIFNSESVSSLTNGSQLPVFLIMDCLNGFFQDVYAQPLGVTLMLASNGGAVAVLASSGLNQAPPQTTLDVLVVQNALTAKGSTLGDAIVKAKSKISDPDVRRTFVLFGDPAMQVKHPAANSTGH